jgi:serine/threonine-protein phosphatase PGAM5
MPTRTLYLVRHGQYIAGDPVRQQPEVLTTLGRKQAAHIGRRLTEVTFSAFHHSTMPRAIETASIISHFLPSLALKATPLLCEGLPTVAPHFRPPFRKPAAEVRATRERMDAAFAKYVRPSRVDRNELIVAHGNIIRYFIRKTLGDAVSRWWQMDILQCSLSIVRITPERSVLVSFNDVGHLPIKYRTHS